jgi:hypothetical protein
MSIGLAIFLSSLMFALIFLYHITRDRWSWHRIGRKTVVVLLIFGGLITLAAGGIYSWIQFRHLKSKQTEYAGLRLGMTMAEAKYVKGIPDFVVDNTPIRTSNLDEGKKIEEYRDWRYADSTLQLVFNDDNNLLGAIACSSASACPEILGITIGDSEQQLLSKLGQPSTAKIDGLVKEMNYSSLGVLVDLRQQKIFMFGIHDTRYTVSYFDKK